MESFIDIQMKGGLDGVGRHFKEQHVSGLNLSKKDDLAKCMGSFNLLVIASVRPPATPEEEPACQTILDGLEAEIFAKLSSNRQIQLNLN